MSHLAARLAEQQVRGAMLERDAHILGLFAELAAHHGGRAAALSPSGRVLACTGAGSDGDPWATGRIEIPADASEVGDRRQCPSELRAAGVHTAAGDGLK
jgi:hypothetical protein